MECCIYTCLDIVTGLGRSIGWVGATIIGFCNCVTLVVVVTPLVGLEDINAVTIPVQMKKHILYTTN